jgi:hypothetical protein
MSAYLGHLGLPLSERAYQMLPLRRRGRDGLVVPLKIRLQLLHLVGSAQRGKMMCERVGGRASRRGERASEQVSAGLSSRVCEIALAALALRLQPPRPRHGLGARGFRGGLRPCTRALRRQPRSLSLRERSLCVHSGGIIGCSPWWLAPRLRMMLLVVVVTPGLSAVHYWTVRGMPLRRSPWVRSPRILLQAWQHSPLGFLRCWPWLRRLKSPHCALLVCAHLLKPYGKLLRTLYHRSIDITQAVRVLVGRRCRSYCCSLSRLSACIYTCIVPLDLGNCSRSYRCQIGRVISTGHTPTTAALRSQMVKAISRSLE